MMADNLGYSASLHFKGKPNIWEFKPDPRYGMLTHTTRAGNTYGIIVGKSYAPVIWIGQLTMIKQNGETAYRWYNATSKLRIERIEFSDGGKYLFPNSIF